MTKYIPEVGPKVIPAHIEERTVRGLLNPPAHGTRMKVTLPGTETVIVGTVMDHPTVHQLIQLEVEGGAGFYTNDITLWIESGWEFEILPALVDAEAVSA